MIIKIFNILHSFDQLDIIRSFCSTLRSFFLEEYFLCCVSGVEKSAEFLQNVIYCFAFRMNHQQQHIVINGNSAVSGKPLSFQHYVVGNQMQKASEQIQGNQNVHVQILKQEQSQQRYIINRQSFQQSQSHLVKREPPVYWLLVEIDSNNGLNYYAMVESKDVVGQPPLEDLSTGKSIVVNLNGRKSQASVVMTSS